MGSKMEKFDILSLKYTNLGLRSIDCAHTIGSQIAKESLKRANRSERAGRKTTGLTPKHWGMVAGLPSERSTGLLAQFRSRGTCIWRSSMSTQLCSTWLNPVSRLLGWLSLILLCFTNNAFAAQITLAWNAGSGPVAGYNIYYGTASGNYPSTKNLSLIHI